MIKFKFKAHLGREDIPDNFTQNSLAFGKKMMSFLWQEMATKQNKIPVNMVNVWIVALEGKFIIKLTRWEIVCMQTFVKIHGGIKTVSFAFKN